MQEMKRLPDAELYVMQIIWDAGAPVTAAYVQQAAARGWKSTSVLTFLARLTDKGFLACRKEGKTNLYWPLVHKDAYLQMESASFLERVYQGSVKNLVASLTDAGSISAQDLQELKNFLDEQGET